ncbi:hypothetical protein VFPPC_15300 [Pochonia chlamydosporia 170]|uniref:Uncharacterized protein n=1 Tax=Pochonia chlamydosporia 170 TaxID=1380566 RepID=A0A179G6G9_METCM|nr:hypothetical protein VFPPC_15300 [Pochonia chlamydosporia 170]OAQ73406.1 hypothetical protein VFPPC_15300 [Pochonia chlamydosporia 170]
MDFSIKAGIGMALLRRNALICICQSAELQCIHTLTLWSKHLAPSKSSSPWPVCFCRDVTAAMYFPASVTEEP